MTRSAKHRFVRCRHCGGNVRIDDHHPNCPEMYDGTPILDSRSEDSDRPAGVNYPRHWSFQ